MLKKGLMILLITATVSMLAACGQSNDQANQGAGNTETNGQSSAAPSNSAGETKLSGQIEIDGSSTVFPLTEAVAEEFSKEHSDVRVPVGVSGTGGGFKRFIAGETDISNASRPIKDEEAEAAKAAGIEYIELMVAYDGLAVIVNPQNDWVDQMTVEELNAIFKPESTVVNWSDVRPEWPNEKINIFSPGADSGTFDYFTEAVNGKAQASRNDDQVSFSEDDNALVQGIAGNKNGLGYFGLAYFEENQDKLRTVAIVNEGGTAVEPTVETVRDGSYTPLSRPLFIYVKKSSYDRPEVKEFVNFFVDHAAELASEVGYVPLPDDKLAETKAKLK
ncbi:MAG: PstS family phosphate ABC transporter substrate-binding protein [Paenibacillus sp.]|uniref:PstS family phosphate ABC transporter substrate-binding protein n=1 Tax=Paenibacillus sp. TaxID=58172 RepID=UPI002902467A|nr:PstS family phosphate ABC transporter substrate-binding protein [Paenibacillus sp.]MDU2239904.1 PstS family phosphate ABC transporter substrate-binding protein [Paenibacillus sp.]